MRDIILEPLGAAASQMNAAAARWDTLNGCNQLRIDFTLGSKALAGGTESGNQGIRGADNPIGRCQTVTERSRSLLTLCTSAPFATIRLLARLRRLGSV